MTLIAILRALNGRFYALKRLSNRIRHCVKVFFCHKWGYRSP